MLTGVARGGGPMVACGIGNGEEGFPDFGSSVGNTVGYVGQRVIEAVADGIDPGGEFGVEGFCLAGYLAFAELLGGFVGAAAHMDGDGAGGDGGGHVPGDAGQGSGGVDGEAFDFHVFGVTDAAGDRGRAFVSGVE